MKKTHNIVAVTGTYESNGVTKNRYQTIGAAFTNEKGEISLKLECVPVGPGWNGWLNLYPPKDKQQNQPAPPNTAPQDDFKDSDLDF